MSQAQMTSKKVGNKRAHVRFRDPESATVKLSYSRADGEIVVTALILDESYRGMACVYVGELLQVGQMVYWLETGQIKTKCIVRRSKILDPGVCLVAIELTDV